MRAAWKGKRQYTLVYSRPSLGLSKMFFVEIGKNIFFNYYFGISELEVPGTWELRHLGTCLRVSHTQQCLHTWTG